MMSLPPNADVKPLKVNGSQMTLIVVCNTGYIALMTQVS
jgi:hypothetical protein